MAQIELIMPKMGESIIEATILRWVKKEGDPVDLDETILEIATDKVDSEVPSPVKGTIAKLLYEADETVAVGKPIAIIAAEGEEVAPKPSPSVAEVEKEPAKAIVEEVIAGTPAPVLEPTPAAVAEMVPSAGGTRFYSPLVRTIARKEGVSLAELESITGSGLSGRVTKKDILSFLKQRKEGKIPAVVQPAQAPTPQVAPKAVQHVTASKNGSPHFSGNTEIIEMDRMRKLIAAHMVTSKHTSPHVTSFVEADVTKIVNWRNRIKNEFQTKYGEKITFTPIFIEAVIKAIHDYPMVNISVQENKLLVKKYINVGMATALPSGNLIVPVIKNADHLSLLGLTKAVNDLAARARANKLLPEDIQGGTFTITNVGTFGNVMGTPIINQPEVAILATGAIRKKPAVVETEYGDLIAVRQMMFLSLSYDHRVVDGFLGGSFLRRIADYLEAFDSNLTI